MPRKDPEKFTTISIMKKDLKKLEKLKIHSNQPLWEIIRDLINKKGGMKK